jgi:predicted GTPase
MADLLETGAGMTSEPPGSEFPAARRRVVIMGAGGRDFHDFNVVYREDPRFEVVAFTAAQIPGIENRMYPPSLSGPLYPRGIPIVPESELRELILREEVDEVVFAYSDTAYGYVMRRAEEAIAAGADFSLLGSTSTMLPSRRPVVSVCATRTGCGKSQTTRYVGRLLLDRGLTVALVRHPMPYHDLEDLRVQRFATIEEIDASHATIEEREEYEPAVEAGMIMFAGVDYAAILAMAEEEADVVLWDGGNNDFSFYRPELSICVTDPLRAGDELAYHPGEAVLRMADVVIVNKVDSATPEQVERVIADVRVVNPGASLVRAASPVTLDEGPPLRGSRVLVVEDGPTITHGGMRFGAGMVAARLAGAGEIVDPRPYAVGSIAETFAAFPHIRSVLPAMGYSDDQLADLAATIDAVDCDVVVAGTPIDLRRIIGSRHPIRRATYELEPVGGPSLDELLAPIAEAAARARA